MSRYRITLKHDSGIIRIVTTAGRLSQAIRQVLKFERAPFRAVVGVETIEKIW